MKLFPRSALIATTLALLSGVALGAPLGTSAIIDPAAPAAIVAQPVKSSRGIADGSYTGASFDAYFGMVQVQANIKGGRLASVKVLKYPSGKNTSRRINRTALPILEREVVSAQSTNVNLVSGATLTSRAYLRSLKSALAKAAG